MMKDTRHYSRSSLPHTTYQDLPAASSEANDHASHAGSTRGEAYGELQHLVDELYAHKPSGSVSKLDALEQADIDDVVDDLREVIALLPGGMYKRQTLCDQLNSIITAHGWGYVYGCVE